jgi:hypothetical protein
MATPFELLISNRTLPSGVLSDLWCWISSMSAQYSYIMYKVLDKFKTFQ